MVTVEAASAPVPPFAAVGPADAVEVLAAVRTLTQSPTARADEVVATRAVTVVFFVYTTAVCSLLPCTCRVDPSIAATVPETPGARPPPWPTPATGRRRGRGRRGGRRVAGRAAAGQRQDADPGDGDEEGGAGEGTYGVHGHSLRRASMGDSRAARLAG